MSTSLNYECWGNCDFQCPQSSRLVKFPGAGKACKWGDECDREVNCLKFGIDAVTPHTCWRRAFRKQLDASKKGKGYMLQIKEWTDENGSGSYELGPGQIIERKMAQDMELKVFCFEVHQANVQRVVNKMAELDEKWRDDNCQDMSLEEYHFFDV